MSFQVPVMFFPKSFTEEVANVTKDDENQIADVGSEEVVIRRLVKDWVGKIAPLESTSISVAGVT